ncbi:hypothetical protein RISK_000824 [Rhodopirellula islandica]|uniref:Uncharacterized protein n=1 Tax=Rhodopirellula islandica TaxID=595434 RepID=A0A0J1BKS2_RHOIS|nr:hypothetical protein RISK_000824 [Rhodopirellula islandica]
MRQLEHPAVSHPQVTSKPQLGSLAKNGSTPHTGSAPQTGSTVDEHLVSQPQDTPIRARRAGNASGASQPQAGSNPQAGSPHPQDWADA